VVDPGDKHPRRTQCIREAIRQVLPVQQWDGTSVTAEQRAVVKDEFNRLYHSRGYNGGARDRERDAAADRIINWFFDTYDRSIAGVGKGSGIWFDDVDLKRADELCRSMIPAVELAELNRDPNLKRCPITYGHLAVALCFIAKNAITSNGAVPTTSIMHGLRFFGLASNGTQVATIIKLLWTKRLIGYLKTGYCPGLARKYTLGEQTWSLPFIADLKPAGESTTVLKEQTARYVSTAGGGQVLHLLSSSNQTRVFGSNVSPVPSLFGPVETAVGGIAARMVAMYEKMRNAA
jgi:hypothetical protein